MVRGIILYTFSHNDALYLHIHKYIGVWHCLVVIILNVLGMMLSHGDDERDWG